MNLIQEFTMTVMLKPPVPIGAGPIGTRMFYDVKEGQIIGDRLRGKLLSGGEWALVGSDGFIRADVRLQFETHDGAYLYFQYSGILELNGAVQSALANGNGTDFDDQHFFTNPRIETGDERYTWLNTTFFIGEGRILPELGVEYRVWRPV